MKHGPSRGGKTLRGFARILGYVVFVSLTVFILTETALWVFFPLPSDGSLRIELTQNLPGLKEKITYTRNRYGFRSVSMESLQKGSRVIRIIALGGSTTEQMNQDTEDIWSAVLESMLGEAFRDHGIEIEVAAWGRGGEKVFDRVRFAREKLIQYEPDIVLAMEGINDLAWNGGPGYRYEGREEAARDKKRRWYTPLKDLKKRYSQIYKRVRKIQDEREIQRKIGGKEAIFFHTDSLFENHRRYLSLPYRERPKRDPDPIVEFRDGIEELLAAIKDGRAEMILLAQPVLWHEAMSEEERGVLWFFVNTPEGPVRASPGWFEHEIGRYNALQEELARRKGVHYVPLDRFVPKSLAYFFDDCHFTDAGNRTAAEAIYPYLLPLVEKVAAARHKLAGPPKAERHL